ncbi:MAG: PepSY domain-containing protein [Hyphomicrobium sp.]|jgi:hypothetical protein
MTKTLIATAMLLSLTATAYAESFGQPCTTEPKAKWMPLEAITKIVEDHGYKVSKAKMKNSCAEVYARDDQGVRVEFFIDPSSGNPVGTSLKAPRT